MPFRELGVATSNLAFFRQIGGSIGLAIAGTVFATQLKNELPGQLRPIGEQIVASVPPGMQAQAQAGLDALNTGGGGAIDPNRLTGVGQSFGEAVAAAAGPFGSFIQPFIPQVDHAFFQAFSIALSQTFYIAIGTTVLAFVATLVMRELPLRTTLGPSPASEGERTGDRPESAPRWREVPAPD